MSKFLNQCYSITSSSPYHFFPISFFPVILSIIIQDQSIVMLLITPIATTMGESTK